MTEQAFDRENYDRSEVCDNCGATITFVEGVPSIPKCYLCGTEPGKKVTWVIPTPEEMDRTCPGCDQKVYGRHGHAHNADCPQIAWVRRRAELAQRKSAMKRHPSVRIPPRILGDRIWSDVENRWTSRGEEFGP